MVLMVLLDRMALGPYPKVCEGDECRPIYEVRFSLHWVPNTGSPPHLPRSGAVNASACWGVATASRALLSCIMPKSNLSTEPIDSTSIIKELPKQLEHHAKHTIKGCKALALGLPPARFAC